MGIYCSGSDSDLKGAVKLNHQLSRGLSRSRLYPIYEYDAEFGALKEVSKRVLQKLLQSLKTQSKLPEISLLLEFSNWDPILETEESGEDISKNSLGNKICLRNKL